jgi:hypothetical protein
LDHGKFGHTFSDHSLLPSVKLFFEQKETKVCGREGASRITAAWIQFMEFGL